MRLMGYLSKTNSKKVKEIYEINYILRYNAYLI